MDSRLRKLQRQAAMGDVEAAQLLIFAQCRAFGHDWKTRDKIISTFPIKYKTINESCKRCGVVENAPDPRKTRDASTIERLLQRYAYGSIEELHREYNNLNT